MSPGKDAGFDRAVSLFALACLAFVLVGPFAAWVAHERSQLPGSFSDARPAAGEEFRVEQAGQATAVWAVPADLDRASVRCTSNGDPLELAPEGPTTDVDGERAVLLLDDEFLTLQRLACSGGGLSSLALSDRLPESTARAALVGAVVGVPVLLVVGILLRRRGYRWPF